MKTNRTAGNSLGKKGTMWAFGLEPAGIEALTHGVFAIAMTILALELSVDHAILASIASVEGGSFWHLSRAIYTYVVGFLALGVYWALHHYMFHFIKRSNGVLVWLHILFLMSAALVPVSTKVQLTYPESYSGFAFLVVISMISIVLLLGIWRYATKGYRLVDRDIERESISFVNKIVLIWLVPTVVALVGGFFVVWLRLFATAAFVYIVAATVRGHHRPFFIGKTESRKL